MQKAVIAGKQNLARKQRAKTKQHKEAGRGQRKLCKMIC
jgi:hypothetical protein